MMYKYTNSDRNVVYRIDDDGICRVSVLAENNTSDDPYAIEFRNWIAEGNAPLPPDEPPVETP